MAKKKTDEETGVWAATKRAGRAVGRSAAQVGGFAANMTPLTATIVAGGLGYLIGAKSNVRIK